MKTSLYKIPKFNLDFRKVFNPLCVWYEDDGCRRPAGRQISLNYFSTYAQWEFGVTSFQFAWIQLILVMFGTNNLGDYKFPLSLNSSKHSSVMKEKHMK